MKREKRERRAFSAAGEEPAREDLSAAPGKDAAAGVLIEYLGVKREELAAFGDGHNDTGLLRFAGIGFAVANASEECRSAADRIVPSNDEDGVAEGIGYILRLNAGAAERL